MRPQTTSANKAALYAPDLPWNKFKADELGPCIMSFVEDHEPFFRRWAETWYENFQFLFGNASVKWSKKFGFAVDYDFLRREGPFAMRANTNLARVIAEALSSFIFGNLPDWEVDTTDQSSTKGKRFRKIGQKLLDAYMHRLLMEKEFKAASMIYVMFGQFAAEIDWNAMAGQLLEIPRYNKIKAPMYSTYMAPNAYTQGLIEVPTQLTGENGEPQMEERWEPVLDGMGRQIIDKMFAGDVGVNMLTPFEYRRELGKYGIHKSRWVQRFKLMDFDEFLDYYKNVPGKTKEFDKIRPVYSDPTIYSMAVRHFMRMQFTTPPSVNEGGREQSVFKSSLFKYKVFVVEHFDRPHPEKWPLGRRVIVANGTCTHITTPSYQTNKLDGWHPFVEAQWMTAPPNSIGCGPMNDVIRKNKEVNVKDGLIATAVRRNMGSHLLIKTGMGLDPQQMSGEPGKTHEVSDVLGARFLHDEQPIPPVISRLREMDKEDIYESSGAMDALRGEASTGATSGYQEKQREEREEKRLTPARKSFEAAVEGIGEKILSCLRANVVKLDDSVMGFMKRAAAGEFSTQDVIAFLSSPMDYGVDVKVVKSSMAIKSKATQQAMLQELANGALGQRLSQDAKVLDKYLKEFDAEAMRDGSAVHRDRAVRENEVFLDMLRLGPNLDGITRPVVIFEDDDNIHESEHMECFVENFEEFRNNEAFMIEFMTHMEQHRIQRQEKEGQVMPGASTQTSTMMAQARKTALPTPQTIYMDSAMKAQQKAMQPPAQAQQGGGQPQNPAAATGQKQAPQAPKQPSAGSGGGATIDPNAPSANTPTAASRGGFQ